jgi:hypothetical protein
MFGREIDDVAFGPPDLHLDSVTGKRDEARDGNDDSPTA